MEIVEVPNRYLAGITEVALKEHVSDKTNWRKMLKGEVSPIDLEAERDRLFDVMSGDIQSLQEKYGLQSITALNDAELVTIEYPVIEHPTKVTSFNFDKTPRVEGVLKGIKGQYLILDTGVINIRKFTGYNIQFEAVVA